MKRKRIDIITLGCYKNLVDSEKLMRQLEEGNVIAVQGFGSFEVKKKAERISIKMCIRDRCNNIRN